MLIHASCAARDGSGVLLTGPPGSGKSDLLLRLLDRGFDLVADDQVEIVDGEAQPPTALAGLMEIRGLGIVHMMYAAPVRLVLSVVLEPPERLPSPRRGVLQVPVITLDPTLISAAQRVDIALDCALGRTRQHVGAFSAW